MIIIKQYWLTFIAPFTRQLRNVIQRASNKNNVYRQEEILGKANLINNDFRVEESNVLFRS